MFNILVCEDERDLRELYCTVLRAEGFSATGAADGAEAMEKIEKENFDLVITDVLMPRVGGYELVKRLREAGYTLPVLMITALGAPGDKHEGFNAGTDDYMVKPVDINEMVWRVRALLRRSGLVASRRLFIAGTTLDCDTLTVSWEGERVELRNKEFFLLYKLCSDVGRIFTRDQLLEDVWGMDGGEERSLEVHISSLRAKIQKNPHIGVVTVRGLGYKAVRK
ncbi:MAG: response regulator transcription factor [Oscillospiraceae bacterium]|nr:response regulator transcription factor [Oscillospiraceae bacterium]MBR0063657.1 response regulator transcription factor [Oscillospiraceae bacterium]